MFFYFILHSLQKDSILASGSAVGASGEEGVAVDSGVTGAGAGLVQVLIVLLFDEYN